MKQIGIKKSLDGQGRVLIPNDYLKEIGSGRKGLVEIKLVANKEKKYILIESIRNEEE